MEPRYRRIALDLLDDIVSGEIPAAAWLPRIEDIAARYACTPTVAREAVRALVERRIVEVHRSRGHQVLEAAHWNVLDADVAAAVLLDHPRRQLLREAVEALTLVEIQAAMLAAERTRSGDVALLNALLERMRVAAEERSDRFPAAEAEFHDLLIRLSNNRFVPPMLATLPLVVAVARRARAPERDQAVIRLHESIVAALAAADPAAAAAAIERYGRHLTSWLTTRRPAPRDGR